MKKVKEKKMSNYKCESCNNSDFEKLLMVKCCYRYYCNGCQNERCIHCNGKPIAVVGYVYCGICGGTPEDKLQCKGCQTIYCKNCRKNQNYCNICLEDIMDSWDRYMKLNIMMMIISIIMALLCFIYIDIMLWKILLGIWFIFLSIIFCILIIYFRHKKNNMKRIIEVNDICKIDNMV